MSVATREAPANAAGMRNGSDRRARALIELERFGLLALAVATILFFTFYSQTSSAFPTSANFENITGNQSVLALVALAAIPPLVCGQFDLSIGAVLGFSSVVTAHAVSAWGLPTWAAIVLGIAAGGCIGLINGLLVARLRVNSLITTLAVSTMLLGLTSAISSTPIVAGIPSEIPTFGTGDWLGIPRPFYVLVVAALALWYFLEQTPQGRELHAIGSSKAASHLVGVPVERRVLQSFVISGLVCGAGGVLQLARSGTGDPNIGASFTLPAIAAVFLGATAIRPGRYNVAGTIVAIFFLAVVVSGLTISGAQTWLQDVINGGALIAGIIVSMAIARHRARSSA